MQPMEKGTPQPSMYRNPQNGIKGCHSYTPLGGGGGIGTPLGLGAPLEPPIGEGVGHHPWSAWVPLASVGVPRGLCPPPPSRCHPCQLRTVTGNEFLLQSDQEATIQEWSRAIRGVIRRLVSAWRGGGGSAPWLPPSPVGIPNYP